MALRSKNAAVLFKIETTEGVDSSPSAATDGVLVENISVSFDANVIKTNEANGSLDGSGPIIGGMKCQIKFDVHLKGSGSAGTAPEWGDLMRVSGWAETLTAAAVPVAAEACAAGGSTTLANLGASAAAVAEAYRGMPISFAGTVAADSFVADYTAGKAATLTDTMSGAIVGTTNYQIPASVLYSPASTSIPSGTLYFYKDGLLYKFVGCRGTMSLAVETGGIGRMSFTISGLFLSKTDAAVVSPTLDSARAPVFRGGKMLMDRKVAGVAQFSLDSGLTLAFPDDPNATEGFSPPIHTARNMTGSVNPQETLVATRDIFSDFRTGTRRVMHLRYGAVAGNRIGITLPQAQYLNETPGDRNGIAQVDVPFEAVGRDAGAFICLY
jgi:hypothetical protein